MAKIELTTNAVDISIDGTIVWFQGDPSGGPAWGQLMDVDINYTTAAERDAAQATLKEILLGFCADDDSRVAFKDMDLGIITLKNLAKAYVAEVTAFPTPPSKPSNRR